MPLTATHLRSVLPAHVQSWYYQYGAHTTPAILPRPAANRNCTLASVDGRYPQPFPAGGEQQAKPESRAAAPAAAQSTSPLASEHAEIAARLMAAGPGGVDIALLTAAAKALRDVSVLDKQFLRAREVPSSGASALGCKWHWDSSHAAASLHAASRSIALKGSSKPGSLLLPFLPDLRCSSLLPLSARLRITCCLLVFLCPV